MLKLEISEQDYANAKATLDKMTEKLDEFMQQLDRSKAEQE